MWNMCVLSEGVNMIHKPCVCVCVCVCIFGVCVYMCVCVCVYICIWLYVHHLDDSCMSVLGHVQLPACLCPLAYVRMFVEVFGQ